MPLPTRCRGWGSFLTPAHFIGPFLPFLRLCVFILMCGCSLHIQDTNPESLLWVANISSPLLSVSTSLCGPLCWSWQFSRVDLWGFFFRASGRLIKYTIFSLLLVQFWLWCLIFSPLRNFANVSQRFAYFCFPFVLTHEEPGVTCSLSKWKSHPS